MWKVRHLVTKGEFKGRYIFDNLVFSEKALKRAKLILRCLGVDVSGEINLTPEMIKRKQAIVTVKLEDYVDDEGREKKRNRVPFAGYEKPDDDDITEATSGGGAKLPFLSALRRCRGLEGAATVPLRRSGREAAPLRGLQPSRLRGACRDRAKVEEGRVRVART
jgi:hypothetical protein